MIIGRRGFITGLGALFAAPAIVHAGNLMPVKVMLPREIRMVFEPSGLSYRVLGRDHMGMLVEEVIEIPRRFPLTGIHGEKMFAKMAAGFWVADNTSLKTLHEGTVRIDGKEVDHWGQSWYKSPSSG